MKQLLVSLSATICALLTVSAACTESEYPPATVEMELTKVSEHVYWSHSDRRGRSVIRCAGHAIAG
jgi:hypothetical protein